MRLNKIEREVLTVACRLERLKNSARDQEIMNEEGVINPDSILLIHATNFPPRKEGNYLVINSSGNADPTHESLRSRKDDYRKYAGLPNMRFTVHFGMPGSYASHQTISEEGKIDYDALAKATSLIVLPLGAALRLPANKICNLNPTDTFFWDKVYLPKGAIIIAQQKGIKDLLLKQEDFDRYQIAMSDKPPTQEFHNLLENEEFDGATAVTEALGNAFVARKHPRLDSPFGTIALSLSDNQHSQSIFHDLEQISFCFYEPKYTDSENAEMILYAKEKEHIEITDEKKFIRLQCFLQSINRFYFAVAGTFNRMSQWGTKNEEEIFVREDEDMRRAIIEKIRPWLGQAIEKLVGSLKENIVDPFECMQGSSFSAHEAFHKRFQEVLRAKEAIESNELLQHEFPQTHAVIYILDEFLLYKAVLKDHQ